MCKCEVYNQDRITINIPIDSNGFEPPDVFLERVITQTRWQTDIDLKKYGLEVYDDPTMKLVEDDNGRLILHLRYLYRLINK